MNKFPGLEHGKRGRGEAGALSYQLSRLSRRSLGAWVFAMALGVLVLPTLAAEVQSGSTTKLAAPITIQLKQFKVVTDDKGDTKLVDASLVLPGDLVEYHAIYANRGSTALPVVATIPIPEAMVYVPDSAKANNKMAHTVALKDSKFSNEPLQKTVTTASGATLLQPVPYAFYRFVRWDLGKLAAGGQVELSVRAKVSQSLDGQVGAEGRTADVASSSQK